MPIYTDPADNIVAQITDKGRNLCTRAAIEGLSFQLYGWAMGRGGYDPSNPVHVLPIVPSDTALIDQIYPTLPNLNLFSATDFETPVARSVSCSCRIYRDTFTATYGIGEIGIWVRTLNSPLNPIENGELNLFSITHTPIQCITDTTMKAMRIIHNF
jgi:hypothetical protein